MPLGRSFLYAMGMALLAAGLLYGEDRQRHIPESTLSLNRNALVTVGGEVMTDIAWRSRSGGEDKRIELRRSNLRIDAELHPGVKAFFKLDLTPDERNRRDDELLEEAMLVMGSIGGTGFGVFAGQGRAPYGQDITLGMIQSYHHSANKVETTEGRVFLVDPPGDDFVSPADPNRRVLLPPMRPGQLDRVLMAGVSYEWDERWRVEAALFDPDGLGENRRLTRDVRSDSNLSMAARVWWRPVEGLSLEASVANDHSSHMGDTGLRADLPAGFATRKNAWSMSLGFDWRNGPWRVFGEYQRAWDWNHSRGYGVDIVQLGAARELYEKWRIGGMAEFMRIQDDQADNRRDDYYKFAVNLKYAFSDGVFVLFEYGHEKMRRNQDGRLSWKRNSDFLGMRFGLLF